MLVVSRYFAPSSTKNSGDISTQMGVERKTAQESYLAVATTWHDIGSTSFADQGRPGRIDHIVVYHRPHWIWSALVERFRQREGGCSRSAGEKGESTFPSPSRSGCR